MSQLDPFWTQDRLPPSRNQRSKVKWVVAALVALAAAALVWNVVGMARDLTRVEDFEGPGTGEVSVTVERGDSLTAIAQRLVQAGVVKSEDAFLRAADADERASAIGPGVYALRSQMSGELALALMLDPESRAESRLVLPEGLTLDQTIAAASEATGIPRKDLRRVLNKEPGTLDLPGWAKDRPEGFLFPASYELAGDEDATTLLQALVRRFGVASVELDLEARAAAIGRDPYEVLIIASLVQAEGVPNDFAKVARVIENRLDMDMPLQLDAAVAYGLGVTDLTLSDEQLQQDTPYNTYTRTGLPPTPINSPGEAAIEAALSPAKGKWLYYVTVNPDTGETKFTRDYDEFLQFKQEFQQYLAEREQ